MPTFSPLAALRKKFSDAGQLLGLVEQDGDPSPVVVQDPVTGNLYANGSSVSGGGGVSWVATQTAAYQAVAGQAIPCDTTGGTFAVAAPTSPTTNQVFRVKWLAGTNAPTVTGAIDSAWQGFQTLGDSQDFSYTGSVWGAV